MRASSLLSVVLLASMSGYGGQAVAADYATLSGSELYQRFCASCHGVGGHGDGPVSASLAVEVPDLTLLTRRARGVFPRDQLQRIVDGRHILGAHGTRTMPVWGEDLSRLEIGNPDAERVTRTVIDRIVDYLATLQKPVDE
jgi:mono/diheme cytochrome c family protein